MSLSITPESKNALTIMPESKPSAGIWADQTNRQWSEADGTWAVPGLHIEKETKNSITITPETKL